MADQNEDVGSDSDSEPVPTTLNEQAGQNSVQYPEPEEEEEEDGYTPLYSAIDSLDLPKIRLLLLSNRYPVNTATRSSHETPLHVAVSASYSDPVKAIATIHLLASYGADLNAHDCVGATPLHFAAKYGYLGAAKALIELGADVNINNSVPKQDREHEERCACGNRHALRGLLGALTGGRFGPREKFEEDVTPLHCAAQKGHVDIVKFLLEKEARIDVWDKDDGTPLHCAAMNGNVEVCKVLLEWEGGRKCMDVTERYGYLPIHYAAGCNLNAEVVRLLLENGSEVDVPIDGDRKYEKGLTPLALACQKGAKEGMSEIVRALLEFGADPNYLAEKKQTPFLLAVVSGSVEVTRLLLEKGADLRSLANSETPPLHLAATKGHAEMCRFLVQEGGCDVRSESDDGYSALHNAAGYGRNKETIQTLVSLGADIEARSPDGRRPLHMACFKGQLECVQDLLNLGADVEAQDDNAWSSLHFAACYGHLEVAKLLLKPDAGRNAALVGKRTGDGPGWNMDDCTAADLAKVNGHEAVLQILVEAGDTVSLKTDEEENDDHS